ncbi:hypothetical protein BG004_004235 [Podila humilis]|nr:hypothetical protein BG004_004235 [Podila humilis]
MMFTGHNKPETYGRFYNWEEHEDAFDWLLKGGFNGGDGLLILEVQERIYQFLADVCLHFLQIAREDALADDSPIEPNPPALTFSNGPVH